MRRIGAEDLLIHDAAHAGVAHRLHCHAAGAGVGISGDAGLEPFHDSEARGIEQRASVHDLVPALAQLINPLYEMTILEEAAHRGELEVSVGVDEAREKNRLAEVVVVTAWRGGARSYVCDQSVALDDGSVLYRRLGDGKHPARVIAHQRGGRPADEVVSVRLTVESRRRVS